MNKKGVIFQLRTVCEFVLKTDCFLILAVGTNFECNPVCSKKRQFEMPHFLSSAMAAETLPLECLVLAWVTRRYVCSGGSLFIPQFLCRSITKLLMSRFRLDFLFCSSIKVCLSHFAVKSAIAQNFFVLGCRN